MRKLLAIILLLVSIVGVSEAAIITRPTKTTGGTSYTDGTVPHASDFNGDVDTVYSDYNGNITNANIAAGAAIAASKILTNFTSNLQVTTASAPCFVNIDSSQGADLKQWRLCQNAGVLSIGTYTDAGALIITPLSIARATGLMTFSGGLALTGGDLIVSVGAIQVNALTAKSFLYTGVSGLFSTPAAPTNGQLLIGNTGNAPSVSAITGTATHLCITNGAGSITLDLCANPAITAPVFSGTPTGSLTNLTLVTPTIASQSNTVFTTTTVAADPTTALGVASKQYIDNLWSTGDVKVTIKTVADTGWIMMDDGTFGDATSGGTTRANADTAALYSLLWANCADTECAVSTGRGGSAAADFAAHKTIALPKVLSRSLAVAGAGSGLTSRVLGKNFGEESHLLSTAEMPAHTHTQQGINVGGGATATNSSVTNAVSLLSTGQTLSTGGGGTHNVVDPSVYLKVMIKL